MVCEYTDAEICKENAIKKAQELDELQAKDQMDGKLFGIPMGIKDNIFLRV